MTAQFAYQRQVVAPLTIKRRRMDLRRDATELLLSLRGRPYLVALLGAWHDGAAVISWDPLFVLDTAADLFTTLDSPLGTLDGGGSAFGGGWIGALGYGLGARLEDVGAPPPRPSPTPLHRLGFYDRVLVLRDGRWWYERLSGVAPSEEEDHRDARFRDDLGALVSRCPGGSASYRVGDFLSAPGSREHVAAIRTVKEAIAAGDLFQANLTQRLEAPFCGDPLDVFVRGWRDLRPARGAYIGWPDAEVASFSPELFLRRTGRQLLTSPIKGTAPADADAGELASSVKDRAENVMIVDLMRNDLARVCEPGSVGVPALNRVEEHAVRHLVSDVVGRLRSNVGDGTLLRHTFPPGSVTGAPKVAALRLLNRLETTAREAYTGAIGYVSPAAGLELSVTIRTLEFSPGRVWLGVGGGITTLSDPEAELEECRVKAEPILRAIGARLAPEPVEDRTPSTDERERGQAVVATPAQASGLARATVGVVRADLARGGANRPRVLVVDNYDSFVYNVVDYLRDAGATVAVVRNDAVTVADMVQLRCAGEFSHLLLSPGPAAPADAGISVELVRSIGPTTPTLGICLGHQIIADAFGAEVVRARHVVHGRCDTITHDGAGVLRGLPALLHATRYHSLAVEPTSLPFWLEPTSWSADGELMGVRHRLHRHVEGLQWHPESILTEHGREVLASFLRTRVNASNTRRPHEKHHDRP